jgi:hypothetical protein
MGFEKTFKEGVRRFSAPADTEAKVVRAITPELVQVRLNGKLSEIPNASGVILEPNDRISLNRVKQRLVATGLISRAQIAPDSAGRPKVKNQAGGAIFAYIADADATTKSVWLDCSESLEFRTMTGRALVAGHLVFKDITGAPGQYRFDYRALIDGVYDGNPVQARAYVTTTNDWPVYPYVAVFGGLSPGHHSVSFQINYTGGSPMTAGVYTYALSATEI